MTKLRLSKKGFYLFNISLLIVGLIITGVGGCQSPVRASAFTTCHVQAMGGHNHFFLCSHPCFNLAAT